MSRVLRTSALLRAPAVSALIAPTPARFILPIRSRPFATATTTETSQSAPEPPTLSPNSTASTPPVRAQTGAARTKVPYYVGRNNFNNFSVYQLAKRGGNFKLTVLKKAQGDLQALKNDLQEALELEKGKVTVNSTTGHIVVRGHKREEILNFLYTMGL